MRALQDSGLSQRAACRITGCPRSVAQYRIRRVDDPALVEKLEEIAAERRLFGYRRLTIMLRREGFIVNHKRVNRIYRAWLAVAIAPKARRSLHSRKRRRAGEASERTVVARLRSRLVEHRT